MGKLQKGQTGFSIVEILILFVIVGIVGFVGWNVGHTKSKSTKNVSTISADTTKAVNTPAVSKDPYANWQTYTSKTEKATFKYPNTWKSVTPESQSNISGADIYELMSPSGAIKLTLNTAISGIGGACDANTTPGKGGCPIISIINASALASASGISVVSAVVEHSDSEYQPWVGLRDSSVKSGPDLDYGLFTGHNNGSLPELRGQNASVIFGTGGISMKGPKLSQADAKAWFDKAEVKEAKLILASWNY